MKGAVTFLLVGLALLSLCWANEEGEEILFTQLSDLLIVWLSSDSHLSYQQNNVWTVTDLRHSTP